MMLQTALLPVAQSMIQVSNLSFLLNLINKMSALFKISGSLEQRIRTRDSTQDLKNCWYTVLSFVQLA